MPVERELIAVEKVLAQPVERASVTKVSLPQNQHFTVTLGGKDFCVFAALEDIPPAVQDFILALGEAQAESLLK